MPHTTGRVDRVEQAVARGLDDAAIAAQLDEPLPYVARIRAAMDRAAEEERDYVKPYSARWDRARAT